MNVPEYSIDDDFTEAYTAWFMRSGMGLTVAKETVAAAIQAHAAAGFRASLLSSIMYYARCYARMRPDLLRPAPRRHGVFIMQGFKPEVMQTCHVPGMRGDGHEIKPAKRLLKEMAEAAS